MSSHTPETIGYFFIHHYYNFLADRMYDRLSVMYDDNCTVYHDDWETYLSIVGTSNTVKDDIKKVKATGKDQVQKLIIDEREKFVYKIAVNNVDIQPIYYNTTDGNDLILISVLGEISKDVEDAGAYSFSQIFTVKGQSNSYAIVNEIFRFFPVDTIDDYVFVDEDEATEPAEQEATIPIEEEELEEDQEIEQEIEEHHIKHDAEEKIGDEIEEQIEEQIEDEMENQIEEETTVERHKQMEEESVDITKKLIEEEKARRKKEQQKEKQEKEQKEPKEHKEQKEQKEHEFSQNGTTSANIESTKPVVNSTTTTPPANNVRIVPAQVPTVSAWQKKPSPAKVISHVSAATNPSLPPQPSIPAGSVSQPAAPINSEFVVHIKFDKEEKLSEDDLKTTMETKFGPIHHCSIKPCMHYGFVHFMKRETQTAALAAKKVHSCRDGIVIQIYPKIKNAKKTSIGSNSNPSNSPSQHHSHHHSKQRY